MTSLVLLQRLRPDRVYVATGDGKELVDRLCNGQPVDSCVEVVAELPEMGHALEQAQHALGVAPGQSGWYEMHPGAALQALGALLGASKPDDLPKKPTTCLAKLGKEDRMLLQAIREGKIAGKTELCQEDRKLLHATLGAINVVAEMCRETRRQLATLQETVWTMRRRQLEHMTQMRQAPTDSKPEEEAKARERSLTEPRHEEWTQAEPKEPWDLMPVATPQCEEWAAAEPQELQEPTTPNWRFAVGIEPTVPSDDPDPTEPMQSFVPEGTKEIREKHREQLTDNLEEKLANDMEHDKWQAAKEAKQNTAERTPEEPKEDKDARQNARACQARPKLEPLFNPHLAGDRKPRCESCGVSLLNGKCLDCDSGPEAAEPNAVCRQNCEAPATKAQEQTEIANVPEEVEKRLDERAQEQATKHQENQTPATHHYDDLSDLSSVDGHESPHHKRMKEDANAARTARRTRAEPTLPTTVLPAHTAVGVSLVPCTKQEASLATEMTQQLRQTLGDKAAKTMLSQYRQAVLRDRGKKQRYWVDATGANVRVVLRENVAH